MPTATMDNSDSGESTTRLPPNSSYSPLVARNTPPRLPTSSPVIKMRGSRRISSCSVRVTASMFVSSVILIKNCSAPKERNCRLQIVMTNSVWQRGNLQDAILNFWQFSPHAAQCFFGRGIGRIARKFIGVVHDFARALFEFLVFGFVEQMVFQTILPREQKRVALFPVFDFFAAAIRAVVVVRRMRHEAVHFRFQQRRSLAASRALDGLLHRVVCFQKIVAV